MTTIPFATIDAVQTRLGEVDYVCGRGLATVIFLALRLGRPIFLEGEAGVGKTEVAKAIAALLGRRLIRLQCYEGLDASSAVYEWNYAAQMMEIRLAEATGRIIRLGAMLTGATPDLLHDCPLTREEDTLTLTIPSRLASLQSEAVERRLAAAASVLDLTPRMVTGGE